MAFMSFAFLIFVAIVSAIYFLIPKQYRWAVLLVASYVYFWLNSEWLLLIMFASTLITFFVAKMIYAINQNGKNYLKENKENLSAKEKKQIKAKTKKNARAMLTLGVVIDLGILLFLKYFNFFAQNVNSLLSHFRIQIPTLRLLLPIGISFYTLQAIAYLVDVYRNKYKPDNNLLKFMLFMSFFPQIVQGPIARYNQLANQLYEGHDFDANRVAKGAMLMLWGFMKKLIIADRIALPVDTIFDNSTSYSGSMVFMAAAFYGIQVYADFSGGMDVARGVSQILGIELELNFRQPYFSTSIEEFWRRWHITLGGWMRDYIFYPLSLSKAFLKFSKKSRKILGDFIGKRLPAFISMFIVYFLVGFWHGSSWKYIAYGIWNGVFIVAGILLTEQYAKWRDQLGIEDDSLLWKVFQMLRTFVLCSIGRFFSRADSFSIASSMIKSMFKRWYDISYLFDGSLLKLGLDNANWILLLISVIILFVVDFVHEKDISIRDTILKQNIILRWAVIYAAICIVLIFGIYGPGYDSASFIYEQF